MGRGKPASNHLNGSATPVCMASSEDSTNKQTQTQTQTHRHTDTQTHTDTHTDTQTHTQTQRHTDTHRRTHSEVTDTQCTAQDTVTVTTVCVTAFQVLERQHSAALSPHSFLAVVPPYVTSRSSLRRILSSLRRPTGTMATRGRRQVVLPTSMRTHYLTFPSFCDTYLLFHLDAFAH